jgi:phenylalanyl-tRNA synthetase alpha chain
MATLSDIEKLRKECFSQLKSIHSLEALKKFEIEWLGRRGKLTMALRQLGALSLNEQKALGKLSNEFKTDLEAAIAQKTQELKGLELAQQLHAEALDLSLPGVPYPVGHEHPLSRVMGDLVSIFRALGFAVADGPEIESEFNNFDALNIPANHPARDLQDTFYLNLSQEQLPLPHLEEHPSRQEPVLLRTHTSPVQVRVMQKYPPPVAIVVPGRVYRHEALDASHSAVFHQLEGLLVDEGVSFADLKGVLARFAQEFYGPSIKTRFRPSFFPFTEPSAEMDISCMLCAGSGCTVCKQSGWLEILGAGMVHPNVFAAVNVDAERYTGFAFGMGIERMAMLKYGVDDIRLFYENDIRFLEQF